MKAYFLSCNALSAGIISAKPGRESPFIRDNELRLRLQSYAITFDTR